MGETTVIDKQGLLTVTVMRLIEAQGGTEEIKRKKW